MEKRSSEFPFFLFLAKFAKLRAHCPTHLDATILNEFRNCRINRKDVPEVHFWRSMRQSCQHSFRGLARVQLFRNYRSKLSICAEESVHTASERSLQRRINNVCLKRDPCSASYPGRIKRLMQLTRPPGRI